MQMIEGLDPSTDEYTKRTTSCPVPLEVVEVGDVPLGNNIANKMKCLGVSGSQAYNTEIRTGSIAAITEIIRGAGAEIVSNKFTNLPLVLSLTSCVEF
jgi:hypothetical protein